MRRYIVLLFGSLCFIMATACSRPAPPPVVPASVDYFYQERKCASVEYPADAPSQEQVRVTQVATPNTGVKVPRPRFYQRWRRVHGRRYHFTYRVGDKHARVKHPDPGRQSRRVS